MKRLTLLLCATFMFATTLSAQDDAVCNNIIRYEAKKKQRIKDAYIDTGDAKMINHTFKNGEGIIVFDRDIEELTFYGGNITFNSITIPETCRMPINYYWEIYSAGIIVKKYEGQYAADNGRCIIEDGVLWNFANGCDVQDYIIPDGVEEIANAAFAGCKNLRSLTIPESVEAIDEYPIYAWGCGIKEFNGKYASADGRCLIVDGKVITFAYGCDLTDYTIPEGVTAIGAAAFWGSRLESITIPASVTTVGDMAFGDCDNLSTVYCKCVTPPAPIDVAFWLFQRFNRRHVPIKSKCKIYVPRESVEAYKMADGWSEYADNIIGYDFE